MYFPTIPTNYNKQEQKHTHTGKYFYLKHNPQRVEFGADCKYWNICLWEWLFADLFDWMFDCVNVSLLLFDFVHICLILFVWMFVCINIFYKKNICVNMCWCYDCANAWVSDCLIMWLIVSVLVWVGNYWLASIFSVLRETKMVHIFLLYAPIQKATDFSYFPRNLITHRQETFLNL